MEQIISFHDFLITTSCLGYNNTYLNQDFYRNSTILICSQADFWLCFCLSPAPSRCLSRFL